MCAGRIDKYIEGKYHGEFGVRQLGFPIVGNFLTNLKQEFRSGDNKSVKMAELKKIE